MSLTDLLTDETKVIKTKYAQKQRNTSPYTSWEMARRIEEYPHKNALPKRNAQLQNTCRVNTSSIARIVLLTIVCSDESLSTSISCCKTIL
ncbi:hypothetical protein CEXT_761371 [Caerostris extrusa]|uniref:Uncharacterized protein n=1 Tax=Caerostris extrusa TaxID=172846 RepID=A0AAV4T7T4_CAEEX|nr:hypothetical protein CEXT_761371 [Caerostris extrusa]